jgi:hypothetical protein
MLGLTMASLTAELLVIPAEAAASRLGGRMAIVAAV